MIADDQAGTPVTATRPQRSTGTPLQILPVQPAATSTWNADPEQRRRLGRRAQLLAGASVTYNVVEAVVAIGAGLVAGSVALVGFGLDSVVEVSSGLIILWQFRHRRPETRERQALRLLACSFFALAAYVAFESVRALIVGADPDTSPVGIGLAIASVIIMPFLSWAQRRTGKALGSNAVVADSTQTLLCTYLSVVLLIGLVLNATLGWGWADPIAGLVIAAVAVREGVQAWQGKGCCAPVNPAGPEEGSCSCGPGCPTVAASANVEPRAHLRDDSEWAAAQRPGSTAGHESERPSRAPRRCQRTPCQT